jgi:hypothetical protein
MQDHGNRYSKWHIAPHETAFPDARNGISPRKKNNPPKTKKYL